VAGTGGVVPRLTAVEPAVAGSSEYTIGIDFARAGAVARVLIASSDPQDANASALLRRDLTIAADGSAALDLALPNGASLQGQTLYLRVYVEDPAATGGWSSTASLSFQLLEVGELLYSQGFED